VLIQAIPAKKAKKKGRFNKSPTRDSDGNTENAEDSTSSFSSSSSEDEGSDEEGASFPMPESDTAIEEFAQLSLACLLLLWLKQHLKVVFGLTDK
jgi:hypothetical protein